MELTGSFNSTGSEKGSSVEDPFSVPITSSYGD